MKRFFKVQFRAMMMWASLIFLRLIIGTLSGAKATQSQMSAL